MINLVILLTFGTLLLQIIMDFASKKLVSNIPITSVMLGKGLSLTLFSFIFGLLYFKMESSVVCIVLLVLIGLSRWFEEYVFLKLLVVNNVHSVMMWLGGLATVLSLVIGYLLNFTTITLGIVVGGVVVIIALLTLYKTEHRHVSKKTLPIMVISSVVTVTRAFLVSYMVLKEMSNVPTILMFMFGVSYMVVLLNYIRVEKENPIIKVINLPKRLFLLGGSSFISNLMLVTAFSLNTPVTNVVINTKIIFLILISKYLYKIPIKYSEYLATVLIFVGILLVKLL